MRKLLILAAMAAVALIVSSGSALADPSITVGSEQKISDTAGGFVGALDDVDTFGNSVANIGDLDGDGISDLAVGARLDDDGDGGINRGAVWILFMDTDGTVKSEQKISDTQGNFNGILDNEDRFGISVDGIGDLDGDGVQDLAVGAFLDDDGGDRRGAVWILFLDTDGTVKSEQKISDTQGGFGGTLDNVDLFGESVASIGDLDTDGISELAVGAQLDDDGGVNRGAVWILFMDTDGTVKSEQKISDIEGSFGGTLNDRDIFGDEGAGIGDLDGDGVPDLAVGARQDDDGGNSRGAVWILFLDMNGKVKSEQKISDTQGNFNGVLDDNDLFGLSLASMGDSNGDGISDLAVGAPSDDDGGLNRGAVWVLFMNIDGTVKSEEKISDTQGNFDGILDNGDAFGVVEGIGDLDGDGVLDLAVGASRDDDGGTDLGADRGAVWILFLKVDVACGDTLFTDTKLVSNLTCSGTALTIGANDITLNCDGHTLTGDGTGVGILLDGRSGVTVKDCHVDNFATGFVLSGSSGPPKNTLKSNTATSNIGRGFLLDSASNNDLKNNTATSNGFRGFDLTLSSNGNTLKNNTATDNGSAGFVIFQSTGNKLTGNTATGSNDEGFAILSSTGNKIRDNTADFNGTFGFRDDSPGTGLAGTANTYPALTLGSSGNPNSNANECTGNTSGGSSPSGLCTPQL